MLRVFNTLKKEKENFQPVHGKKVGMYVCGVTVYDLCHIGHARSAVVFDVIRRYLAFSGYDVTFVKNFTDIDDKIIKRSNESGTEWRELTRTYMEAHDADMDSLNVKRPDKAPKATDFIPEMIAMCENLIAKGHAYVSDGDVYYRVESFSEYGKLSHRRLDEMTAGARVEVNERKENPYDFVLWKSSKPNEPSWESPWGPGRPGWHIECSVMSEKILGLPFDIHGGGKDLVFPHHENEIAQSEAACGCEFARYWMHNGFVNINEEKMSKSLGNFFTIRDVTAKFDPEIVRFFLLTTHYRSALDFSDEKLKDAESSLDRIYTMLDELNGFSAGKKGVNAVSDAETAAGEFLAEFERAMNDDFNTPVALAAIFEAVRKINKILAEKPDKDSLEALRKTAEKVFGTVQEVLGVIVKTPEEWFKANLEIPLGELEQMIEERQSARKEKNFERADEIRKSLSAKGIELLDTPLGTKFRAKKIRD
ncbi:MAG: cysteine--tRNA ligase [Deferribacterales bacterium]